MRIETDRLPMASATAYVGRSERTLRRYVALGTLPAYRVGKGLVFKIADLDNLLVRIPAGGAA